MNSDDDEFKILLGRIGNRGRRESFVNQVLRAMRKAGHEGSAAGSKGAPRYGRSTFGRGRTALAHPNVKSSQAKLAESLRGRVTRHHRFLLQLHLQQIDSLDTALGTMDGEIEANLPPFRTAVEIVSTHPGISKLSAQAIVSEIGTDLSRFATAGHLLSWAGLCPRNDESAGRRRSNRLRKGAQWLKTTLVQCAQGAKNKKGSYYQAQYLRLRSRRGPQKAICAVAASILTAIFHMLKNGTLYQDLGADHFNRRSKNTQTQRLVKRLEHLGYAVQIQPLPA
jgi:transposase